MRRTQARDRSCSWHSHAVLWPSFHCKTRLRRRCWTLGSATAFFEGKFPVTTCCRVIQKLGAFWERYWSISCCRVCESGQSDFTWRDRRTNGFVGFSQPSYQCSSSLVSLGYLLRWLLQCPRSRLPHNRHPQWLASSISSLICLACTAHHPSFGLWKPLPAFKIDLLNYLICSIKN